jgi:N12 class adenine-specific DNA methylase
MDNRTYDVKELRKILNLSEATVRELIRQGKINKLPINKPIRVTQAALDEFLDMHPQATQVRKDDEIVIKKKELLELISTVVKIQNETNTLLGLLQNKLR